MDKALRLNWYSLLFSLITMTFSIMIGTLSKLEKLASLAGSIKIEKYTDNDKVISIVQSILDIIQNSSLVITLLYLLLLGLLIFFTLIINIIAMYIIKFMQNKKIHRILNIVMIIVVNIPTLAILIDLIPMLLTIVIEATFIAKYFIHLIIIVSLITITSINNIKTVIKERRA